MFSSNGSLFFIIENRVSPFQKIVDLTYFFDFFFLKSAINNCQASSPQY